MNTKSVLITGATGKTGVHTVRLMLERGHRVRAFVHRKDIRAENLEKQGAEIVVGDLLDLAAVTDSLTGIDTAYFCYPIEPGLVEATAYFSQAARDTSIKGILNMSQISARREAKSNAARQHWISERIFDWSCVPTTHIRPTFFAEWFILFAESIAKQGVFALPFGSARHAPVAAVDQAYVIAAILENPELHTGQTYPLFGPLEMNHTEIAAEIGRTLGRQVQYQPLEIEAFAKFMKARGLSPHLVQHISNVAMDYREGIFAGTNDVIQRIGGITPTTVGQFIENNKDAFLTT
jgi:NAD(P)H dehydrogenase (quinone)